jgi:hypothetical protein
VQPGEGSGKFWHENHADAAFQRFQFTLLEEFLKGMEGFHPCRDAAGIVISRRVRVAKMGRDQDFFIRFTGQKSLNHFNRAIVKEGRQ